MVAALAMTSVLLPSSAHGEDVVATPDSLEPSVNLSLENWQKPGDNRPSPKPRTPRPATNTPPEEIDYCYKGVAGDMECEPDEPTPRLRAVTAGDVERAAREIGMPRLRLTIQPGGETLVNVPTIFFTRSSTLRRTVTLLGRRVEVVARPTSFTWHHGDGTRQTTSTPGKPYPAHDVTHRYRAPGQRLGARVDTTYTVRYRVGSGAWQELGTTLTAVGPTATIDVDEAAPVLVDH